MKESLSFLVQSLLGQGYKKLLPEAAPWLSLNGGIFYDLNASSSPEIAFFGSNLNKKFLFLK